jgi:hypothetical protein
LEQFVLGPYLELDRGRRQPLRLALDFLDAPAVRYAQDLVRRASGLRKASRGGLAQASRHAPGRHACLAERPARPTLS